MDLAKKKCVNQIYEFKKSKINFEKRLKDVNKLIKKVYQINDDIKNYNAKIDITDQEIKNTVNIDKFETKENFVMRGISSDVLNNLITEKKKIENNIQIIQRNIKKLEDVIEGMRHRH